MRMSHFVVPLLLLTTASGSAIAMSGNAEEEGVLMAPGEGLSLDVGPKKTMSYFEPKNGSCGLTLVVASQEGGMTGSDTPGTRITVQVVPGASLRIDTSDTKSAEFFCGAGGAKMNVRKFDRAPYSKDGKKS